MSTFSIGGSVVGPSSHSEPGLLAQLPSNGIKTMGSGYPSRPIDSSDFSRLFCEFPKVEGGHLHRVTGHLISLLQSSRTTDTIFRASQPNPTTPQDRVPQVRASRTTCVVMAMKIGEIEGPREVVDSVGRDVGFDSSTKAHFINTPPDVVKHLAW